MPSLRHPAGACYGIDPEYDEPHLSCRYCAADLMKVESRDPWYDPQSGDAGASLDCPGCGRALATGTDDVQIDASINGGCDYACRSCRWAGSLPPEFDWPTLSGPKCPRCLAEDGVGPVAELDEEERPWALAALRALHLPREPIQRWIGNALDEDARRDEPWYAHEDDGVDRWVLGAVCAAELGIANEAGEPPEWLLDLVLDVYWERNDE